MKPSIRLSLIALLLLAAAVLTVSCEDTELTAPGDAIMVITANPATVVIDPNIGSSSGQSTIIAQLFDAGGLPLQNIAVLFSTSAGTLDSASGGAAATVKTNQSGIATDVLTLSTNDPDQVTITAQSSSLSQAVQVNKTVVGQNEPPRAAIIPTPNTPPPPAVAEQLAGSPVLFDGSVSIDPDGPTEIICYQWAIDSNVGSCMAMPTQNCRTDAGCPGTDICVNPVVYDTVAQGPSKSSLSPTFPEEMDLLVTLRVSDSPVVGAACVGCGGRVDPPCTAADLVDSSLFSPFTESIPYRIVCNNPSPVADAGPDIRQNIQNAQLVRLDGSNSFDNETPIDRYVWNCGNGSQPRPSGIPAVVFCTYTAVGDYEAMLTVWDQGDGTIDPGTGAFNCQKLSTDTAQVTIFDPAQP